MARYIDAELLKLDFPQDEDWEYPVNTNEYVCERIDKQPTADVVEIKHGHWKWDEKHKEYYCPICQHHKDTEKAYFFPPYCNICGAKMDEEIK